MTFVPSILTHYSSLNARSKDLVYKNGKNLSAG